MSHFPAHAQLFPSGGAVPSPRGVHASSVKSNTALLRTVCTFLLGCLGALAPAAESLRTWDVAGNLRVAAGHKENVLLSAVNPQSSALAQLEGELFVSQLPADTLELLAFANATFTRFLDSAENPHELQAFAHAELRWLPTARLRLTPALEAYHLKQVFDLSVNDVERRVALLAVTGGLVSLAARLELPARFWLELKPTAQRERFRDRSDDHVQHLGRITLGRPLLDRRVELSVSAEALRRTYDTRPQYTAAGRRLTGTELIFERREAEARAKVRGSETSRWSTTTAAVFSDNRDNGSGFFNYHHRALRQELAWRSTAWKAHVTARAGRYDYDVQTEGIGINPPFRLKEEFSVQARVERTLSRRVTVFASYLWERSRSNDPLARYRAQTACAGADLTL